MKSRAASVEGAGHRVRREHAAGDGRADVELAILHIQQEIAALDADLPRILTVMVERACALVDADGGALDMIEGRELVCHAVFGTIHPEPGSRLRLDSTLAGLSLQAASALVSHDTETDPRVDRRATRQMGARSLIVVPLSAGDEVIAVLKVVSKKPHAFADRDVASLQILAETLGATLKRHRMAGQLQASEQQYRLLFAQNPQPMWVYDPADFRVLAVNRAMQAHYGYSEQELLAMTMRDIWFEQIPKSEETLRQIMSAQASFNVRRRHRRKDGSPIDVDISSSPILFNGVDARLVSATDVTLRLRAERELARVSRAQQMLSTCNDALIRATSQDALLAEICRITVEVCGYRGAWVGLARDDVAKSIQRVASAGLTPGYLDDGPVSWSEEVPHGRGPAGRTIRSGQTDIVEDIENDEAPIMLRDRLVAEGFRSLITLPLHDAGRTFGLLILYTGEIVRFGPEEVKLLQELANNLAFGINNLRAQQESRRDVQARIEILRIQQEIAALDGDLPYVMTVMAERARELAGGNGASIDLLEGDVLVRHARTKDTAAPLGARLRCDNSLSGLAVRTASAVMSDDTEIDPRVYQDVTRPYGVRSLIVVPLTVDGAVIGVLKVASKQPRAFAGRDVANLQILVETLGATIKRHRIAAQLQASEQQYRGLFAESPQPMWVYEIGSLRLLAVNQAMAAHYGYSEQELLAMNLCELWLQEDPEYAQSLRQRSPTQWSHNIVRHHRKKDGTPIDVELSASPTLFAGAPARLVLAVDVTQRLRAERELARVSRAQRMLSNCNEALIRATSQDGLLREICRITVDIGGYLGAWVGFARDDESKSIELRAFAGVMPRQAALDEEASWSEKSVRGRGPAGRTIRSGETVIVENIELEELALLPRKDSIRAAGIHSLISLPLRNAERTFGVLFLFANEVIEIGPDEVKLLQELANDLAFGIGNLRAQEEQRRVQAAVLKVAAAVSASAGLEFFAQLARNMAEALGAHAAFVSRLLPVAPPAARTLVALQDGRILANFDYPIQGSPSEAFTAHSHWVVNEHAADRYPADASLARANAQAYVGQRLDDADGVPVGQIFVLFRERLEQQDFVLSTLRIFAARAAAEMQREKADAYIRDQAALLDKAQDAIIVRGMDDRVLFWNHSAERLYGWTSKEALGSVIWDRIYHDPMVFQEATRQVMAAGAWTGEVTQRRKDGSALIVEGRWTLVRDDREQPQSILTINTDITQRKAAEREIQRLAFYDPLTQLPNRLLLMDRLQQTLASCTRTGRCGALLFIDLDNFKTLNDTLGHEKGDMLLQHVAVRLAACVRETDTVARFGGDEFVVMLEDLSDHDAEAASMARIIGEKVLTALAEPYLLDGYAHRTSSSIGIAPFGQQHEGPSELLKQADLAMYQAKTAGRNAMRFFDPTMQAIVNARVLLEAEMRLALARQEYMLHYQPQFDAVGQITGVEALLRWRHPKRGLISPAEFIPLAEETGIIIPLGQWVLRTACNQLNAWQASSGTTHLTMAVNVSARQFHSTDFVAQVTQVLVGTGADSGRLKLELTESMLVDDLELTIAKMSELKALGLNFSLDDFGTGYSSLSYLKRLPLDQLKIDQSFVRDIVADVNDASIVRTIIALGQSLGLAVIAEGVETSAQRDFLASHGCLAYQGYLFSPPLPLEALQALLDHAGPFSAHGS
ncbi:MAG TPA: EAL domain-containing protein [Burkholderiaceae bacterium]|nr:EAL domain-containing protein [Burkholderiaceae bacterium]